jgi:uncharacterized protein (DUF2147 family)
VQSHLIILAAIFAQSVEPAETSLEGLWRNPSGSVIISISPCDESICGRVQWASEKAMADARKGGTDPLVGTEVLSDITPRGEGPLESPAVCPRSQQDFEGRASYFGNWPTKGHWMLGWPRSL